MGTFDLVICTHTLGSIPIGDLPVIVDRLHALANKALYIAEKLAPVKKQVFGRPELHPFEWDAARWAAALKRESSLEVVLSVREQRAEGVVVERMKL